MNITSAIINNNTVLPKIRTIEAGSRSFCPPHFGAKFKGKCALSTEAQERLNYFVKKYDFEHQKPVQFHLKRIIDILGSSLGLILTSPITILSAVSIKLESKGPILFKQKRLGKLGEEFTIYKFRSMYDRPDSNIPVSEKKDPRLTKAGQVLRKFSIDEIPQLFNIIKGDMSLVGPRPYPSKMFADSLLKADQNSIRRFVVRPGASLNYKALKDDNILEKIATEQDYLDNWSLTQDIKHFFGICKKMLNGKNY